MEDVVQHVALLREGIVILSDTGTSPNRRVEIAGACAARVLEHTARVLGGDVAQVDVLGAAPRVIRSRPCLAHREREPRRLQLRMVLTGDEHCDEILVAEDDDTVVVYATVCTPIAGAEGESLDCPFHVWLDRPLGDRVVIDGVVGEPLPVKKPR